MAMTPITYGRNGMTVIPNQLHTSKDAQSTASGPSFGDFLKGKVLGAVEASRTAEQAPQLLHQNQISEAEYSMAMNEAMLQLTEFKTMVERGISAIEKTLQAAS